LQVRNLFEHRIGGEYNFSPATIIAGWNDLQKKLYGHLTHGQETVFYVYYELWQTWKTTSDKAIRKSAANPNTVTALPTLNATNQKLIADIPSTLEWLKRPIGLSYLGRGYWSVTETWTGIPKASVIYGGTFTGLDP